MNIFLYDPTHKSNHDVIEKNLFFEKPDAMKSRDCYVSVRKIIFENSFIP